MAQLELARLHNKFELREAVEERLVFGSYPEVITAATKQEKTTVLDELAHAYLLKDILELERVKGAGVLLDLLRLLAFQIGNEVSLTELGTQLGLDYKTVGRYLDLLEKAFVLYRLRGYSRNLRKEVTSKHKSYFLDTGVRNAIIANFNGLVESLRDRAALATRLPKPPTWCSSTVMIAPTSSAAAAMAAVSSGLTV